MSSRRAHGRPAADAKSRHSDHLTLHPPSPESPPKEEAGNDDETPHTSIEGNDSGADAGGGGTTKAGVSADSGTMRAAVLSDPAVVCQLAAADSNN